MLNIVLFGPPGAGKGTQAERLVEKYGFNHISTGELIRAEIAAETPLGLEMKDYIAKGHLAPDELVIDMVTKFVSENKDAAGNIFDGFPRTTAQAEAFDRILAENGILVDMMLALDVPDDEVVRRILNRAKDSGRADDMDESVIRNRLAIYKDITEVVSNYYDKQGKFTNVNGIGTVDEIFDRLSGHIDTASAKK